MAHHFISDLHLSPQTPELIEGFTKFIHALPLNDTLYILGDFFDSWIGDDDTTAEYQDIQTLLKSKTDAGLNVYFMRGNRDFAVGDTFATRTGAVLLDDPSVITLYEKPYLLMHGDSLCTDDKSYMRFRRIIRNPLLIRLLLSLPLTWRRKIAESLRGKSQSANASKQMAIMDVSEMEVASTFKSAGINTLIHGHTHRPRIHHYDSSERVVLGDWGNTGWVYTVSESGSELKEFAL